MKHPRHQLEESLNSPVRFSIVAALNTVDEAEFAVVRDAVEVSDSVLSKHVATLERARLVAVRKGYVGKRPRTWLRLTKDGRRTFASHVAALRAIADGAAGPT
ncbi:MULTISPECIES: winged helix-turn-helix domain-containing protein [Isoptericola]|uniref:winged helix-turn-helix domain-containing protein n=1 Tax=Isoptericola TaxID=254250 RepID=UPI00383B5CDE